MAAPMKESMIEGEIQNSVYTINLQCFWDLAEVNREIRIRAAWELLKSLKASQEEGAMYPDLAYSLERLIKGLGSPRKAARQGFTLVLTQILRTFEEVNLNDILKQVEKHLPLTGNKRDIGNNTIGQVFAMSAIVHSGKLKDNPDCISNMVMLLLSLSGKRSYIQQIIQKLLYDIFEQLSNDSFMKYVWPHLKKHLKSGWEHCTPDNLWLLFICSQLYPDVLNRKFLKKYWNTIDILDKENFIHIAGIVKQSTSVHPQLHPVCTDIVKCYLKKEELKEFWRTVIDENLFLSNEKIYLGFEMIKMVLPHLKHQSQVQAVLLPNFCQAFIRSALNCQHSLNNAASDVGYHLARFVSETEDPIIQILVLEIFVKPPSTLLFDKLTKKKTLANIISYLKSDAVKHYTEILKATFLGKEESDALDQERRRSFAIHQISVLVDHQAMTSDIAWKKEIVQFLLLHSYFSIKESHTKIPESSELPAGISTSLREDCRTSLSRALEFLLKSSDAQKFHMEEKCKILVSLLQYTDQLLNLVDNFVLLTDVTVVKEHWNIVIEMIRKLQTQQEKDGKLHESCAFQIIFVHLAFQLLTDSEQTSNFIKELQQCCKHALTSRHESKKLDDESIIKENTSELQWIEVVVDLLLSLLSHSSHLARRIVMTTFPFFCPFLTTSALNQIMDVINPEKCSEEYFLQSEQDDDVKSDSGENEESDEDALNKEFHSDVTITLEEASKEIEDSEQYLSDSEMFRFDDILAAEFSSKKKILASHKKPTKEEIDLLHFRLRCLDLLFLLLKSGPSLSQVNRIISPLVSTLKYGVQHKHQSLLAEKVRRLLQMIVKCKKWQNTTGVYQEELKTLLQFLIAKAKRVTDVQMQQNLSQLCVYIVYCSKKLYNNIKENASDIQNEVSEHWYIEEYKLLLKSFLENSTTNIHTDMFISLMRIYPETAWEFTDLLLDHAFCENIRLYKRTQILGILLAAIKATEPLSNLTSTVWTKFCFKLMPHMLKAMQDIVNSQEVKPTYTIEILDILMTVAKISLKFNVNIFQEFEEFKSLQNLSPKQRQKLQKKGRQLWRKVSKIIGLQS